MGHRRQQRPRPHRPPAAVHQAGAEAGHRQGRAQPVRAQPAHRRGPGQRHPRRQRHHQGPARPRQPVPELRSRLAPGVHAPCHRHGDSGGADVLVLDNASAQPIFDLFRAKGDTDNPLRAIQVDVTQRRRARRRRPQVVAAGARPVWASPRSVRATPRASATRRPPSATPPALRRPRSRWPATSTAPRSSRSTRPSRATASLLVTGKDFTRLRVRAPSGLGLRQLHGHHDDDHPRPDVTVDDRRCRRPRPAWCPSRPTARSAAEAGPSSGFGSLT